MNKKEIIDELHKMGYEVKEETLVKNGVNVLGVSIIDSDRFMIPVFHIDDIIKKAESIGATARAVAEEMLDIHNDAIRESEELDEYSYAAEPPVQFRLSHLSRRSEPL